MIWAPVLGCLRFWPRAPGRPGFFAIESDPTLEWLRILAHENGLADRIVPVRGLSTEVSLDVEADVLISDLRGVLPFFGLHLPALIDARERWLKPGGRLIAQVDTLWMAPVAAESWFARQVGGFEDRIEQRGPGLSLRALRRAASNHWCRVDLTAEACLAEPVRLGSIDYRAVSSPHFNGSAGWQLDTSTECHGVAVWFDTELDDSEAFSNRPSSASPLYGQAFFPWHEPMSIAAGDRLEVDFDARLVGEDYVFRWRGRQLRGAQQKPLKLEDQSTFYGAPLGLEDARATLGSS